MAALSYAGTGLAARSRRRQASVGRVTALPSCRAHTSPGLLMDVVNCEDGLLRARICMGPPPRQTRILTSQPSMERVGVLCQAQEFPKLDTTMLSTPFLPPLQCTRGAARITLQLSRGPLGADVAARSPLPLVAHCSMASEDQELPWPPTASFWQWCQSLVNSSSNSLAGTLRV